MPRARTHVRTHALQMEELHRTIGMRSAEVANWQRCDAENGVLIGQLQEQVPPPNPPQHTSTAGSRSAHADGAADGAADGRADWPFQRMGTF